MRARTETIGSNGHDEDELGSLHRRSWLEASKQGKQGKQGQGQSGPKSGIATVAAHCALKTELQELPQSRS